MSMWGYVHTFPEGYRPPPQSRARQGAVVRARKDAASGSGEDRQGDRRERHGQDHQRRRPRAGGKPVVRGNRVVRWPSEDLLPAGHRQDDGPIRPCGSWPPMSSWPTPRRQDKFGVDGVPVVLKPGVKVERPTMHPVLQSGRVQPGPRQVHRPVRKGPADGGEHVQRLLDAHAVPGGDRRRESVSRSRSRRRS